MAKWKETKNHRKSGMVACTWDPIRGEAEAEDTAILDCIKSSRPDSAHSENLPPKKGTWVKPTRKNTTS